MHRVGEREWLKKKHNTDEKFQILRSVIKSFYFVVDFFFFFFLASCFGFFCQFLRRKTVSQ